LPCRPKLLRAATLQLVKPLIELRIKQHEEQFADGGRWRGESRYTPEVNRRFQALLEDRTSAGDQALAYLLTVYMGEHPGEELVCEVVNRGARMVPLARASQACQPLVGLEPLPRGIQGSGVLCKYALDELASGRPCQYEN
jgi:hypothetical protein